MPSGQGGARATVVSIDSRCVCENHAMMGNDEFSDEELAERASEWRRQALRGVRDARGIAHEYETELLRRRRAAGVVKATAELEMALLAPPERPWWKFW